LNIYLSIHNAMTDKRLLAQFFCAITLLLTTASLGQCVIPIANGESYFEDFEGDGFDCWTVESNGGNWTTIQGTSSTVVSFSYENNGDEARLISPILNMSELSGATFSFSFAMMGFTEMDELEVTYRSSESDPWHLLELFSFSDFNNVYEEMYELENLSTTYQVSFLARGLGGFYIFVDNIEIASTMGCARPVSLQANDITPFSAVLSWSTNGNEEAWILELNGVETTVTTQPYLIEDLRPFTDYTFRVKAKCEGSNVSEWALPITFTTLCDVIKVTDDMPYFDDFEGDDDFVCWQNEIITGIDPWVIDPGYLILNNTAFFIWLGGEARLYSAPLDLSAVTEPTLMFNHKQLQGEYGVEELYIWYRTAPTNDWQPLEVFIEPTTGWETVTLALPNATDTYQIAFNGIAHNGEGLYVDDVTVGAYSTLVGLSETTDVNASVSPNPTTGTITIETNISQGTVSIVDMTGRHITTAEVADGHATIDLSDCAKGIYMARINSDKGSTTVKLVKE